MSPPEDPPPDWTLLPHHPARFFGLSDPIDRKDLKRAYNRLLRRFKPEKAPEEFQRIRAAYESLDEQLRYGDSSVSAQPPPDWNAEPPALPEPTSRHNPGARTDATGYEIVNQPAAARPLPKSLEERLDEEPPEAIYAELSAKADKSPYEYYALAVLSDMVERGKPLRFAEWLLTGLSKHPDSGPLWRLLHDYLRGPLPAGAEEKLLPAIARVTRDDSFYPLTEPLWLALLRRPGGGDPVESFATLLAKCERELRDERVVGRMAFYIQLAKAALLVSDHPWPLETLDYIEANFEQAPPWLEADLDMLAAMREYKSVQARFAAKHPLCRQLDEALRAYFLDDQQSGDRAVVACQVAIAQDLDSLEAAFPLTGNDLHERFYPLWMWVSWDVGERNAPPPKEDAGGPQPRWQDRAFQLMAQLDGRLNSSAAGVWWSVATLLYRAAQAASFLAVAVVTGLLLVAAEQVFFPSNAPEWFVVLLIVVPIAAAIPAGMKLSTLIKNRVWSPYCMRTSERLYRTRWRRPVLLLQERSHLDDRTFRACFAESVSGEVDMSGYINLYVQQDYAPAMLSHAQRFMA